MVHALLQVDCTAMCVGSACTEPLYNDKNPSSVFCFCLSTVLNDFERKITSLNLNN